MGVVAPVVVVATVVVVVVTATLMIFNRKVFGSNPNQNTAYPNLRFSGFTSVSACKRRESTLIGRQSIPSTSFPNSLLTNNRDVR